MCGFGLAFDGVDTFRSRQSVPLAGVAMARSVLVNRGANWARWVDSFANTTTAPITIKVAFGGQSGTGAAGTGSSATVSPSSGDAPASPVDLPGAIVSVCT